MYIHIYLILISKQITSGTYLSCFSTDDIHSGIDCSEFVVPGSTFILCPVSVKMKYILLKIGIRTFKKVTIKQK